MDKEKYVVLLYEFLSEQGGLEREIINHARFLMEEGYKVEIITCHLDKNILSLLPFDGLKVMPISLINTPFESLNLMLCFLGLNKLNEYNPDLFITYSMPSNFLIRNKNAKIINYINHYPHFLYEKNKFEWARSTKGFKRWFAVILSLFFGRVLKKIDYNLLKKNSLNLVNSNFTKTRLERLYGLNFSVCYPPIDSSFTPSDKKINKKFIFSASRIIPDKKYEWLIESLSYLKENYPLYLAGSVNSSYKNKLLVLAKIKKVNIHFLGKLDTYSLRDYYSNALVSVFPAPKEDFGLVPAESLACGTPVIAWDDGAGPTEQIIDGVNGYLANPYDLNDFAKKISLCIKKNLKQKNKDKIISSSKKFSYETIKKEFIQYVNNII